MSGVEPRVYGSSHWAFTPRAVVVAKPPEGVVFASFRADVSFGHGTLFRYVFRSSLPLFWEGLREWRWDFIETSFGERRELTCVVLRISTQIPNTTRNSSPRS